ncbi:MAG TPA: adenylate/guanylate cyclase domain-containing protein, partial [Actinomycetota bacterium]|nr:adenylate/guanylate cyclase domain-containing protein [Actinomycetota bacterium]
HCLLALTSEVWLKTISLESQMHLFTDLVPFLLHDYAQQGEDLPAIPELFVPLLEGLEPRPQPEVFMTYFDHVSPEDPELPAYRVNFLVIRLAGPDGAFGGIVCFGYMAIRPNLVALLARGDEAMYQRMAKLTEPGSRQAAILFCDIAGSGDLSRRMSSATYFKLVRELWTSTDAAVAANRGMIGKHAGDGASAFFLVDDLGSASGAARAALATARRVHELAGEIFQSAIDSSCLMRVGVHWGGTLYMGQLVPGGRLDVSALGDEVNECARIQEVATRDQTLASKQLLEQLTDDDAASLGLDLEKIQYSLVSELPDAPEKVVRDAGAISVASV